MAWGPGIYQNDIAGIVKNTYRDGLCVGKQCNEITQDLLRSLLPEIQSDESFLFWVAVADQLWNHGCLSEEVKDQVLVWIEKGGDIEVWAMQNARLANKRRQELHALKKKLQSPQPANKIKSGCRLYKCEWKEGDVFALSLGNASAKEHGLDGRYLLIQKVDEAIWHPGHVIPVVYVKITPDASLPTSIVDFDQLQYVQVEATPYEWRFLPIDGSRPREDIEEKSKKVYNTDQYGFLPQYRLRMITTSKKKIPSKLFFVGNFQGSASPKNEFIPHSEQNITSVSWSDFEDVAIDRFLGHNLRRFKIYK